MRILILITGLCAALILAPSAPAIAGPARALLPDAEQGSFAAVGRLNVTGQGYCSATLVAPDLVMTAAHCLVDRRSGRLVSPDRVHFLAGFRIGKYAGHGRAAEVEISAGYSTHQRNVARDMALVRLRAPMPAAIRPIPVAGGIRADLPITVVSYGIDRAQIASVERDCRLSRRIGSTLYTDCEGVPGVSGAPLLQKLDGQVTLVAVASAVMTPKATRNPRGDVLAVEATGAGLARLHRSMIPPDRIAMR